MKVPYDIHKPDSSTVRAGIDAVLQGAFKNWAAEAGWEYSNRRDKFVQRETNPDGSFFLKDLREGGLTNDQTIRLIYTLLPDAHLIEHGGAEGFDNYFTKGKFDHPTYSVLRWGKDKQGQEEFHAIAAMEIKDGRVYYRNPHGDTGQEAGAIFDQPNEPVRRVEDPATGMESMAIAEFRQYFISALEIQIPNAESVSSVPGSGARHGFRASGSWVSGSWVSGSCVSALTGVAIGAVALSLSLVSSPRTGRGPGEVVPPTVPTESLVDRTATGRSATPVDVVHSPAAPTNNYRQSMRDLWDSQSMRDLWDIGFRDLARQVIAEKVAADNKNIDNRTAANGFRTTPVTEGVAPAGSIHVTQAQFDRFQAALNLAVPAFCEWAILERTSQPDGFGSSPGTGRFDGAGEITLGELLHAAGKFPTVPLNGEEVSPVVVIATDGRFLDVVSALNQYYAARTNGRQLGPDLLARLTSDASASVNDVAILRYLIPVAPQFANLVADSNNMHLALTPAPGQLVNETAVLQILTRYPDQNSIRMFIKRYDQIPNPDGSARSFMNDIEFSPLGREVVRNLLVRNISCVDIAKGLAQDPTNLDQLLNAVGDLPNQTIGERIRSIMIVEAVDRFFSSQTGGSLANFLEAANTEPATQAAAVTLALLPDAVRIAVGLEHGDLMPIVEGLYGKSLVGRTALQSAFTLVAMGPNGEIKILRDIVSDLAEAQTDLPLTTDAKRILLQYTILVGQFAGMDPMSKGHWAISNGPVTIAENLLKLFELTTDGDTIAIGQSLENSIHVWTRLVQDPTGMTSEQQLKQMDAINAQVGLLRYATGKPAFDYTQAVIDYMVELKDPALRELAGQLALASIDTGTLNRINPDRLPALHTALQTGDADLLRLVTHTNDGMPRARAQLAALERVFGPLYGVTLIDAIAGSEFSTVNKAAIMAIFYPQAASEPPAAPTTPARVEAAAQP